jgi:hypothetical protein
MVIKKLREISGEIDFQRHYQDNGSFKISLFHEGKLIGFIAPRGIHIHEALRIFYKVYTVEGGYEIWETAD